MLFLETSALAKLYVTEAGTDRLIQLLAGVTEPIFVCSISRVELKSAISRRAREGSVDAEALEQIRTSMEEHWRSIFVIQPVSEAVLEVAFGLLDRYALKAYDSVQLAAALTVANVKEAETRLTFVTSDVQLARAAEREGLRVVDPAAGESAG